MQPLKRRSENLIDCERPKKKRKTRAKTQLFTFKITLETRDTGAEQHAFRTIVIPSTATFFALHKAIQISFGWNSCFYNYHLHEFRTYRNIRLTDPFSIQGKTWGIPHDEESEHQINENKTKINTYFTEVGQQLEYEYDFGDAWEHRIELTNITEKPRGRMWKFLKAVDGQGACPPEDSHGMSALSWWNEDLVNFETLEEKINWARKQNFYSCHFGNGTNGIIGNDQYDATVWPGLEKINENFRIFEYAFGKNGHTWNQLMPPLVNLFQNLAETQDKLKKFMIVDR